MEFFIGLRGLMFVFGLCVKRNVYLCYLEYVKLCVEVNNVKILVI